MKIGIKIGFAVDSAVKDVAVKAEALGFDAVWLSERVATPLDKPHPYEPSTDPWIGLAYVAAVTERVHLGTSVSQIALRPPVLMARELATLDRLSGGRLIVGAGAGWVEEEFTSTGVPYETRGGRLSEFVRVLRHLWTHPEEPWQGKHFHIPSIGLARPLTPGGPPIYIGAGGPAGVRRAARVGDGFIAVQLPVDTLARLREQLRVLREQYGRSGAFPFYAQATAPVDEAEAESLVRRHAEAGIDGIIIAEGGTTSGASFMERDSVVGALLGAARATSS